MQRLTEAGIPSVICYPKPLHLQEAFAPWNTCPATSR